MPGTLRTLAFLLFLHVGAAAYEAAVAREEEDQQAQYCVKYVGLDGVNC